MHYSLSLKNAHFRINISPQTVCITAYGMGPNRGKLRVNSGKKMQKLLRVHSHTRFRVKMNFVRDEFVSAFFFSKTLSKTGGEMHRACIRQLIATNRHSMWHKGTYSYSTFSNKFYYFAWYWTLYFSLEIHSQFQFQLRISVRI